MQLFANASNVIVMNKIHFLVSMAAALLPFSAAKSEEPFEIDIVSFNIRYLTSADKGDRHWNTRKHLVAETVQQFNADIIGIQEAFDSQLKFVLEKNPGFAMTGVGRDNGKTRGEYSAILFRKDRFELDPNEHGTFWLSDTPEKAASKSWGNNVVRICTWARLIEKETKRGFYVFNTHFDHQSQNSREQAVRLIARRIADRKSKDPIVLTGDFNAGETNPAILYLKRERFVDTFRTMHPETKDALTLHWWKGDKPGTKIDYVFVQPGTKVLDASIDRFHKGEFYPSDHYPVRARLQF